MQPAEPVFGVYKFGFAGKVSIELKEDSSVVADMRNTPLQKSAGIDAVNNNGVFTFRNDSIFINW